MKVTPEHFFPEIYSKQKSKISDQSYLISHNISYFDKLVSLTQDKKNFFLKKYDSFL